MHTALVTLHLLAVIAAAGGALAGAGLLARARRAVDPEPAAAFRVAAAVPVRSLQVPGMVGAVVTGVALAAWSEAAPGGWLIPKLVAVAWLVGASRVEAAAFGRIAELARAEGTALDERAALEAKLDRVGKGSAAALLVALALSAWAS